MYVYVKVHVMCVPRYMADAFIQPVKILISYASHDEIRLIEKLLIKKNPFKK